MKTKVLAPIHPGEILMEEFLKPLGISQYKLAKDINSLQPITYSHRRLMMLCCRKKHVQCYGSDYLADVEIDKNLHIQWA